MNIVTERKRFRKQFNDEQWAALTANTEFKTVWDSDDIIRAGERVAGILIGTRQEWRKCKLREYKERIKEIERQELLKAAERIMKTLMEDK
jgi:hypothetical protein